MTVQYLSATELQRSASAVTVTFSHTAPAGQKGILVGFARGLTSGAITAVSYGGTNLVQVARATDTSTEPGAAEWWYAPHTTEGAQNVAYNQGLPGSMVHVVAISVGGDATPYVQGSRTQSENTLSLSVSLTTGYVTGLAFGALYWGGAAPGDVTLGANQTLVHDWDMGAYGSKVTRSTNATSSGTYYHTGGNDDVAFAVVFLTDGTIAAGDPQTASIAKSEGRAPTLLRERLAAPGTGAAAVAGRAPSLPVPLNSHEPTLLRERRIEPGLGAVAAAGRTPTTVPWYEGSAAPGSGSVTVEGRAPSLSAEALASPAQGAVDLYGRQPDLLTTATVVPTAGTIGVEDRLMPSLLTATAVSPTAIAVLAEGRAPEIVTQVEVLGTATPDVGAVAVAGQAPALSTEAVAEPSAGSVATAGRSPELLTELAVTPDAGAVMAEGRAPALEREGLALPGVATALLYGRTPEALPEGAISPQVGAVSVDGRVPTLTVELQEPGAALPGLGLVSVEGRAPTLFTEALISPSQATAICVGQAPTLQKFTAVGVIAEPEVGTVIARGNIPVLEAERLIEPGLGSISADGLAPTILPAETLAGRLIRRGRKRIPRYAEESLSAGPVIDTSPELRPEPPAHFTVPLSALGGVDTSQIAARIQRLEAQARRRARQRREEEEIIQFLMKVA